PGTNSCTRSGDVFITRISAEKMKGYKTGEIIGKNFGPSRIGISRRQPAFYISYAFTQGAAVCNRRINKRRLQSAAPWSVRNQKSVEICVICGSIDIANPIRQSAIRNLQFAIACSRSSTDRTEVS